MTVLEQGHADPLHLMYCGHHGWLVQWLQRKLGNHGDADDLAQDTYMRLATARSMPAPDQARPYLVQIAKRLMIDLYRRRKLEAAYLDALAALPEQFSPSHEETMIVLQTLGALDQALGALPDKVRETFFLSQFDGHTYSEIALRLGIAVATVRKHMLTASKACFLVMQQSESLAHARH